MTSATFSHKRFTGSQTGFDFLGHHRRLPPFVVAGHFEQGAGADSDKTIAAFSFGCQTLSTG